MKEKLLSFLAYLIIGIIIVFILIWIFIFYPLWKLFSWLITGISINIGINWIRNRRKKVQIPVLFYENADTRRKVVFIGVIHVAEPSYYAELQRLIDSLHGYAILFEGIGSLSHNEKIGMTKKEWKIARGFLSGFEALDKTRTLMSLQKQRDGLTYPENWINTDMRMYDLVRLFARYDLRIPKKVEKVNTSLDDKPDDELAKWFVNKMFSRFAELSLFFKVVAIFSKNLRLKEYIILNLRNEVAMRGINKHLATDNVAAIWGAGHLPGMAKMLKQQGFREVERQWLTAYHVRDYSLLKYLKDKIKDEPAVEQTSATTNC